MNLFTAEPSISGNIVTLNRDVTRYDVNITPAGTTDEQLSLKYSYISAGVVITPKPELISDLLAALSIKVDDNGNYSNSDELSGLTDRWDSTKITAFDAMLSEKLKFNGLRTEEAKKNRMKESIKDIRVRYNEQSEAITDKALKVITQIIVGLINRNNENVTDSIKNVIVELKVTDSAMDKILSAEVKDEINDIEIEIAGLDAKIKALKEIKRKQQDKAYQIKRTAITAVANKQFGEQTQAIVKSLEKEEKTESHFFFG